MTDRELLELAAKAVGQDYWIVRLAPRSNPSEHLHYKGSDGETHEWNPLKDDGDAFRLAVTLELCITIFEDAVGVGNKFTNTPYIEYKRKKDLFESTRRAIVLQAAEIGKLKLTEEI